MLTPLVSLKQGNDRKYEKLKEIVNIDGENLQIVRTSKGILMKFSGKIWLMIILKITNNQDITLSLWGTFLEGVGRSNDPTPSLFRVKGT